MKRLFLIVICLFIICACSAEHSNTAAIEDITPSPTATPIPTVAPTPTATPNPSKWKRIELTDQFGDPNGSYIYYGVFSGTYSDKYNNASPLTVEVGAMPLLLNDGKIRINYFGFLINEQGIDGMRPTLIDSSTIKFSFKIDGEVYYGKTDTNDGWIIFGFQGTETSAERQISDVFRKALLEGKEIACSIIISKYSTSSYTFKIDGIGFEDLLNEGIG